MPDILSDQMSLPGTSAFIWYHSNEELKDAILDWQAGLAKELGIDARLLIRQQDGKTTFMEIYEHVGLQVLEHIETLAKASPCFSNIERRCESFTEVRLNG